MHGTLAMLVERVDAVIDRVDALTARVTRIEWWFVAGGGAAIVLVVVNVLGLSDGI